MITIAPTAPLSAGMNNGVNIHIILVHKSLIDKPNINRCWGLLLLNADLVTCDIIISDPMADRKHEIFCNTNNAIWYESVMLL